jgi:hypothetical protein
MLSALAEGDDHKARHRAEAARELALDTQDRLLQTVVAVVVAEALGEDALPPTATLPGVPADGWRNVARLALGATPFRLSGTTP